MTVGERSMEGADLSYCEVWAATPKDKMMSRVQILKTVPNTTFSSVAI